MTINESETAQIEEAVRGSARLNDMGWRALRQLYDHQQYWIQRFADGDISKESLDRIIKAGGSIVKKC